MIDSNRLQSRIQEMASIGKTEDNGNTRLALSPEDKAGRVLLTTWMKDIGLEVRIDDFGNIYGKKKGSRPELSPVVLGSHIDTVPNGGHFDGVLGVLGALEAVETFIHKELQHDRSIVIASFTNEEGARFTPQMLGSGAITGQFSQDYTYNRTDANGLRFVDELRNIDFLGDRKNRLQEAYSYIELHIEQGPVLEQENISIGIVQGISGFAWFEVTMKGASNHSGTTPMYMRKDSLTAATATIQRLNKWAFDKMGGTVLTVGKIHATPGSINVIPKETVFTIDVRIPNQYHFDLYLSEMKQIIKETSEEYSTDHDIHPIRTQVPVPFSRKLMDLTETICHTHDLTTKRMMSGAAHDAMYMTDLADTAMIFVPSIDGISHSPDEHTRMEDIHHGVTVLYDMMHTLST